MQAQTTLPIHNSKVLIIWNRSYKNLGDELILIWTIKLLLKNNNSIVIQAYDSKRLRGFLKQFVDMNNIIIVTEIPKGARSIARYLKTCKIRERATLWKCDHVIVWWGEILTEENPNSYWYWLVSLIPSLMRQVFVKTHIHLMWGIQIPKKHENNELFKFLLKHTENIWARDEESVDALKKYGFKNASFFMDTAYFAYDWNVKKTKSPDNYIVVNLNKNGAQFANEIIKDIKWYVNKWYKIYYVPVSKGNHSDYNDIEFLPLLQDAYPKANIEVVDREADFARFVHIISGASMVFSARLHLFLIASFLKVPTKVYAYQKKIIKMQWVIKNYFA